MKGAFRLAGKELSDVFRERTIVLALVVQLFVAAFSTFLAVGLVALYQPGELGAGTEMQVGYAGPGGFAGVLDDQPSLDAVEVEPRAGLEAFRSGELDALIIEEDANASQPARVQIRVPEGELRSSLLVSELKTALDEYEHMLRLDRSERLEHQVLRVEGPASPPVAFSFAYSTLLPLLVAAPVFLAGAVSADSLSDEINEGTLLLLRSTPLSSAAVVVGKLITPILLVPAQVALWMALMTLNGLPIAAPGVVLVAATALGTILSASGVLTASMTRREGLTQAAYTLIVLALSGVSLLMPQDPANLVARAGVGNLNAASYATLGLYALVAALVVGLAVKVVGDRMEADRLQPGVA